MIHLYIGDGKGKTTAAIGLLVRSCGAGKRGLFCQFLKSGASNELNVLSRFKSVDVLRSDGFSGFFPELSEDVRKREAEKQHALALAAFERAVHGFDIAVFDEFLWLVHFGIISEDEALSFINRFPKSTELVLTGRIAPQCLIDKADYVTEMRKIHHPFDDGLPSRRGIEF